MGHKFVFLTVSINSVA